MHPALRTPLFRPWLCLIGLLVLLALSACAATPQAQPTDPQAAQQLALAQQQVAAGNLAEARANLDQVLVLDPTNHEALMLRAGLLESINENEAAVTDLDVLLGLDPNDADAHILRGSALTALGRPEAAADFQTALRLRPNAATILAMQAIAYAQSGKHAAAQSDFSRALQLGLSDDLAAQVRKVIDGAVQTPGK